MGPPTLDGPKVPTTLEPTQVCLRSMYASHHFCLTVSKDGSHLPSVGWGLFPLPIGTGWSRSYCIGVLANVVSMQGSSVVQAKLSAAGKDWLMTCVSMGNPHAITYGTADGSDIKARLTSIVPCTNMDLPAASCCFHCMHQSCCIPVQVDDLDLAAVGPEFENNAVFPARINTEFVEVSQACLKRRTRGACTLNDLHMTPSLY